MVVTLVTTRGPAVLKPCTLMAYQVDGATGTTVLKKPRLSTAPRLCTAVTSVTLLMPSPIAVTFTTTCPNASLVTHAGTTAMAA